MSGETIADRVPGLRVATTWLPAFADRELAIIWNDGRPRGLVIDGTYYAVRPSPGLRHYPGDWRQTLYERPERP